MSRPRPSGRSYGRLTRHERNAIERMLDRNRSAREIAAELGRSPSTVTREVAAHRYVTAPRSRYGEPAPEDLSGACPRLAAWPRCCNGCSHRRGYGCSRRPRVFYSARRAQEAADAELDWQHLFGRFREGQPRLPELDRRHVAQRRVDPEIAVPVHVVRELGP